MKKEISLEKAERKRKKRIDQKVSKGVLQNTIMLNELDFGFGPEHISLSRRKRKR